MMVVMIKGSHTRDRGEADMFGLTRTSVPIRWLHRSERGPSEICNC